MQLEVDLISVRCGKRRRTIIVFLNQRDSRLGAKKKQKYAHLVMQTFDILFDRVDQLCLVFLDSPANLRHHTK
jgi:hypothetical protein